MGRNKQKLKFTIYHKLTIIVVVFLLIILADPLAIRSCIVSKNHMYVTELEGSSMQPHLEDGELGIVLLKTAPHYDLQRGDIVVYYNNLCNCYVGHRVLLIDEDYVYAKGDNNDYVDSPIEHEYVIGELVDHVPGYNVLKRWLVEMILSPALHIK